MLEDVQKFGLRMSTKHWDFEYSIQLHELNLESLERRRGIARLCLLSKIINSICYFNSNVFNFCNTRTYHSFDSPFLALTLTFTLLFLIL